MMECEVSARSLATKDEVVVRADSSNYVVLIR
jgi:hypothetical protein